MTKPERFMVCAITGEPDDVRYVVTHVKDNAVTLVAADEDPVTDEHSSRVVAADQLAWAVMPVFTPGEVIDHDLDRVVVTSIPANPTFIGVRLLDPSAPRGSRYAGTFETGRLTLALCNAHRYADPRDPLP